MGEGTLKSCEADPEPQCLQHIFQLTNPSPQRASKPQSFPLKFHSKDASEDQLSEGRQPLQDTLSIYEGAFLKTPGGGHGFIHNRPKATRGPSFKVPSTFLATQGEPSLEVNLT